MDDALVEEYFAYLVMGKEVGAGGLRHLQCFCVMKKPTKFEHMRLLMPFARNLQPAEKSEQTNAAYCKKGEQSHEEWTEHNVSGPNYGKNADFFEHGLLPEYRKKGNLHGSKKGGEATKEKWEAAWNSARNGNFEEVEPKVRLQNYRSLVAIRKDYMKRAPDNEDVCGVWIYGEPGTGKSYKAREMAGDDFYDKPCNKWWDGYQQEKTVIIDDFDKAHACLGHHLKRWADRYSFPAENKGSTLQIRPAKVIVTSNYQIREIWPDDSEMQEALLRRFHIVHMHRKEWWKKRKSSNLPPDLTMAPMKKPRTQIVPDTQFSDVPVLDLTQNYSSEDEDDLFF